MYRKYLASFKYSVVQAALNGLSIDEINVSYGSDISSASLRRWCSLYQKTRSVVTNPETYEKKGVPLALSNEERTFVFEMVTEKPTIYLEEIQHALIEQCNLRISIQTISNELHQRLHLSRKTMRKVHPNQDMDERSNYIILMANYNPNCLVFTGEW